MTIRIGLYSLDRMLQPLLSSALGRDFVVSLASDEEEMNQLIASDQCEVMVLDLSSTLDSLKERVESCRQMIAAKVTAVVMADDGLRSTTNELIRLGAFGYCRRPPNIRDLKTLLRRAHENAILKRQLQQVQQRLEETGSCDGMIGSSPQMQQVYSLIESVADLNASVLITGESGTGKELIARAIHNTGCRKNRPFVAVSCGAIPETLIESELFGHERGAFTGSVAAREGYMEQAADGTLFLDEIGELSPYTQVKLLRVLQQKEFNRLGSNRLIPLRARVIFATHQDLSEMVAQGKFRQDLYYRINVMRIEAPALQEHPEDIPQIAMHFLRQYAESYDKRLTEIDPEAMTLLQNYSWPGNVRELENVMQRAIIMARGSSIGVQDLPVALREDSVVDISDFQPDGSFERKLRDYKVKLAETAVRENNGNKTLAARSLCISRAYLHRLIRSADPNPNFDDEQELGTA